MTPEYFIYIITLIIMSLMATQLTSLQTQVKDLKKRIEK